MLNFVNFVGEKTKEANVFCHYRMFFTAIKFDYFFLNFQIFYGRMKPRTLLSFFFITLAFEPNGSFFLFHSRFLDKQGSHTCTNTTREKENKRTPTLYDPINGDGGTPPSLISFRLDLLLLCSKWSFI